MEYKYLTNLYKNDICVLKKADRTEELLEKHQLFR